MFIDSHVHVFPDVDPRVYGVPELVARAKQAGYRGLVLKSAQTETAGLAALHTSKELPLWGGVVLNKPCGGLNAAAVESMLSMRTETVSKRGRIVWLPTRHSECHVESIAPHDGPGIGLFENRDPTRPHAQLIEILDLISQHDAVLATGHTDPTLIPAVVALARSRGVQRIVITHVDQAPAVVPPEVQKALSNEGCYIEHCFVGLHHGPHAVSERLRTRIPATIEGIVAGLRATGSARVLFSTDAGAIDFPEPVAAMQEFTSLLQRAGVADSDIELGAASNVLDLLGGV